ncbi:TIGR01777 family oxidoreductase [Flavobacteriaceae bacterium]|nr:TIGR01777 family oxidoreductase [Flavobacteriaceae bacterium]
MSNTVLITGATGLVGKALVKKCLQNGFNVHYLTTRKSKIKLQENYKGFYWNPQLEIIDISCFEGVNIIINLAGSSIAQRWTKAYKSLILSSRKKALELLHLSIETHDFPVKHIISASAIGIYPDSKTRYYEEDFQGTDISFLRTVVRSWEGALKAFNALGVKTTALRIGIVLDKHEGALPKISGPIKGYIGSALGSGDQWQSWIHIDDLVRMFMFILDSSLEGVFNAVAPNPVRQKDFVKSVANVLKRPIFFPKVPEFILNFVLGEMSAIALESQRVSAQKIQDLGFEYDFHELDAALCDLL